VLAVALTAVAATVLSAPSSLAGTAEQFTVPFSGDQVVPGPGDPDGAGGVFVALGTKTGTFCFFIDTANISTPLTAVHLHRGVRGQVGEVVVDLYGPSTDPDVSGCLDLGREQARDIRQDRGNYYIDMHSEEFPDGALRAQLG
ncbi:CHRD domain-containing protein, partial [Actinopolymorpha pittospori]|uniref:CHRD domain-containing protein n=1 Tax=Actinopolymorpha pittospori TaxID=648752 RepID=UPI0031E9F2CC